MLILSIILKVKIKSISSSIKNNINNIISKYYILDKINSITDRITETLGVNNPLPTTMSGIKSTIDSTNNSISTRNHTR
jgi:peptidoglycan hydrolase CwlO-like protein